MSPTTLVLRYHIIDLLLTRRYPDTYSYLEGDVVLMLDDGSCPLELEPTDKNIVSLVV